MKMLLRNFSFILEHLQDLSRTIFSALIILQILTGLHCKKSENSVFSVVKIILTFMFCFVLVGLALLKKDQQLIVTQNYQELHLAL